MIKVCKICGNEFEVFGRSVKTKYCSPECAKRAKRVLNKMSRTRGYKDPAGKYNLVGFRRGDTRRINARRHEVYARMRQLAALDGNRK